MKDIKDWFPSANERPPMRPAEAGMKPHLPRRFYKRAGIEERDGQFVLVLDGRPARTPSRKALAVPTRGLGEALAAEWDAQGGEIDPSTMPITRIVNSTIDGVEPRLTEVIDDLVRYSGSDLVCYRATDPERLAKAQDEAWRTVLEWAQETWRRVFPGARGHACGTAAHNGGGNSPGHRTGEVTLRDCGLARNDDPVGISAAGAGARPGTSRCGCRLERRACGRNFPGRSLGPG
jgi:hypothetical protein